MSKGFVIGFIVGIAILGVVGVDASWQIQKDAEQAKYQAEIVDATPVQLGILTQKQRFHSRLHNGAGMRVGGKSISEWIASYSGQKIFLETDILGRRFLASDQLEAPEDFFSRFAQ